MQGIKDLPIEKKYGDLMVLGEKKTEFRKSSKGLITGIYRFVSIEQVLDPFANFANGKMYPKEVYGYAYLKPTFVNPELFEFLGEDDFQNTPSKGSVFGMVDRKTFEYFGKNIDVIMDDHEGLTIEVDKESYKFVRKEYVDKFDFTAYSVGNVQEKE